MQVYCTSLLCDLVSLRQIRVKVVFAVKGGSLLYLALQRKCCFHCHVDRLLVQPLEKVDAVSNSVSMTTSMTYWLDAGKGRIYGRHMCVDRVVIRGG